MRDDVVGLQEVRRGEAEEDHQRDQAREGEQLLARGAGTTSCRTRHRGGRGRTSCGRAVGTAWSRVMRWLGGLAAQGGEVHDLFLRRVARGSSPVMRPSHITRMRWLSRRISGSSDEIMTIALPCAASAFEQLVDLGLGADVDAARRLVEEQDVAVAQQPLGDDDLLLVAAREQPHLLPRRRRLDAQLVDVARGGLVRWPPRVEQPARPGEARQAGQRDVVCARPCRWPGRSACGPRTGSRCRARIASCGVRMRTGCRARGSRRASSGSAPKTARATSVRPAPIRPAKPRISPLRTREADVADRRAARAGPRTSSTIALRRACRAASARSSVERAADHQRDDRLDRRVGRRHGGDVLGRRASP